MSALDTQVGGSHYTNMAIQPMEYSMANELDACQHTIIKYVSRFRDKNGIQDLIKAKHVIDMLIEFEGDAQAATKSMMEAPEAEGPCDDPACPACHPGNPDNRVKLFEALDKLFGAKPKKGPTVAEVEAALKTLLDAGAISPTTT